MQQSQTDESDDEEEELEPMSQEMIGRADAHISASLLQPSKAEHRLHTHTVDLKDRRATIKDVRLETQASSQHNQDFLKQLSPQPSIAIPGNPSKAPSTQRSHIPSSAKSPASHITATTLSATAIQPISTPTSPFIIQNPQPNTTSSTPQTTPSRPAKLSSLDDRIDAAMLADNITPPQSPPSSYKKSRPLPPPPSSTIKSPHSTTPKSIARYAARKAAYEAAKSGEWGARIRLSSMQTVGEEVEGAGLEEEIALDCIQGNETETEEDEEDLEEEDEGGMIEAGRWGE